MKYPTLCWSYKKLDQRGIVRDGTYTYDQYLDINLKWYKLSIYKAKQLGYPTAMYCDKHLLEYWKEFEYLDEVHLVPEDFCPWYWDGYKFYAMYVRDDNPIALDHDVILNKHFINNTEDIVVDSFDTDRHELYNRKNLLDPYINNGVKKLIPEWTDEIIPLACSGVIQINDNEIRDKFFKSYLLLYEFMIDHKINPHYGTGVGGEFLISYMAKAYDWSSSAFNQCITPEVEYANDTYMHYFGNIKYKKGIVNFDYSKPKSAL
jgi:hypothetical protein